MASSTPRKSTGPQNPSIVRRSPALEEAQIKAPAQTGTSVSGSAQPAAISRGICSRLSHWLWPRRWGAPCESVVPDSPPRSPSRPRPTLHIQPYDSASLDCKGCREWNVTCDHARPQCGHCYDQQIICFYVSPKQQRKRKPKRSMGATGSEQALIEARPG
ncbi:hypothetical protein N7462_009757 [Penicillium macrosclerotiorum]|uniref:uncharacterized protein n=1 Tax=Penicillium macrosclerotiorum TaxID=303699 RepID=UPI002549AE07|nr:uncharacterized protein N7462_009757 [Penicillium macrosclerotiorum]KAJ5668687.1 hypothetical protein N7462_009757 [Penicillium macrosclerotiorum]